MTTISNAAYFKQTIWLFSAALLIVFLFHKDQDNHFHMRILNTLNVFFLMQNTIDEIAVINSIPDVTSAMIPIENKYNQYLLYLFYSDKTQSAPYAGPFKTF